MAQTNPMIEVASDGTVPALVAAHPCVVLVFHATWCGPCKAYKPIIEQVREHTKDVQFVRVDIDRAPNTAALYQVKAVPTVVLVKNGREVDRLSGVQTPSTLLQLMQQKFL